MTPAQQIKAFLASKSCDQAAATQLTHSGIESPSPPPSTPPVAVQVGRGSDSQPEFIALELERLHRDGAIAERSAKDPDASFYANLIRDFGATYVGPVSNVPAASEPPEVRPGPHVLTKHQRVPRGLSKAELQRDLDDAIAYEPSTQEIAKLPPVTIDLTAPSAPLPQRTG